MTEMTSVPSAADVLTRLVEGNGRFVAGRPSHPNQDAARRAELAHGQRPGAVVFGCSDSRLAAEIIFDCGLGDLFVVRTAGHVIDPGVLGSIEFGVAVLTCPLVIVLGHDSCGAVAAARAAVEQGQTQPGYVRDLVATVTPSVLAARNAGFEQPDEYIEEHVRQTVALLTARSRILSDAIDAGSLSIAGLRYQLADGTAHSVTGATCGL